MSIRVPHLVLGGVESIKVGAVAPAAPVAGAFWLDTGAASVSAQPLDSDLTDIAALAPANDDMIQRKAGAWANRTIAQIKADLGISTLFDWPKLRLDFALPGAIYIGSAQTAGLTYNLHTPQNFTVNSLLSVVIVDLRLNVLLNATAAGVPEYSVQCNIDAGAAIHPIGGEGGNNTGTAWFTVGGGIVALGPGLTAGTHSIVIQGIPNVNVNTYLRNGGTTEFLKMRLIELNP